MNYTMSPSLITGGEEGATPTEALSRPSGSRHYTEAVRRGLNQAGRVVFLDCPVSNRC